MKQYEEDYNKLVDVFNSPGWKEIIHKDAVELVRVLKDASIHDCITTEQWNFRRGYLTAYLEIMNYQIIVEKNYQELLNQEMEDASL